jgi:non-heme chloroperoxidase
LGLNYNISGKGKTLVFVHGAFINSEIWMHQKTEFSKYYQIITIDLPSHGKSTPQATEEYHVEGFSKTVISLLDELNITQFTIIGLSLGAMIAQCVASKYPLRVEGIVLVGSSASMRLSLLEKTITAVLFPKWLAMWLFGKLTIKQFLKLSFMMTWFMRGNKWLGGPVTRQKIRESIQMIERSEIKKIYAAVHTFRKQNLKTGDYPVMLINGQYDSPVIHYHSFYLKKELQERASIYTVPNTGHACNFDNHESFNGMLFEWLKEKKITSEEAKVIPISEKDCISEYNKLHESRLAN